jgi:hypothetical protein
MLAATGLDWTARDETMMMLIWNWAMEEVQVEVENVERAVPDAKYNSSTLRLLGRAVGDVLFLCPRCLVRW